MSISWLFIEDVHIKHLASCLSALPHRGVSAVAARVAVAAARGKDVDTAAGVGAAGGGGASGPSSRRSSSSRSRDEGGEGVRASASGADMVGGRAWATRRSPFSFEAQRVPGSAARGQHRSSHRHSLYLSTHRTVHSSSVLLASCFLTTASYSSGALLAWSEE